MTMTDCCESTQDWVDITQPANCDETLWFDDGVSDTPDPLTAEQTLWFDDTTETHWDIVCDGVTGPCIGSNNWSTVCP